MAAAGDTGLELKMKDGRMVRMHYDTEPDRTMWLAVLAMLYGTSVSPRITRRSGVLPPCFLGCWTG